MKKEKTVSIVFYTISSILILFDLFLIFLYFFVVDRSVSEGMAPFYYAAWFDLIFLTIPFVANIVLFSLYMARNRMAGYFFALNILLAVFCYYLFFRW